MSIRTLLTLLAFVSAGPVYADSLAEEALKSLDWDGAFRFNCSEERANMYNNPDVHLRLLEYDIYFTPDWKAARFGVSKEIPDIMICGLEAMLPEGSTIKMACGNKWVHFYLHSLSKKGMEFSTAYNEDGSMVEETYPEVKHAFGYCNYVN